MFISPRRDWKPFLLSLFASTPVGLLLILGMCGTTSGPILPGSIFIGTGIFLLEGAAVYFLFHIRNWWAALFYGIFLFLIFVMIIITMARVIGIPAGYRSYVFQLSPFICISIVLLKKYLQKRVIERFGESIDLLLLLLSSFFIVFHAFKLRMFLNGELPSSPFNTVLETWEVISFIPIVLLLIDVRRSGEKRLILSASGILFQDANITKSFSFEQLRLLSIFLKGEEFRAACGDIVSRFNSGETVPEGCTDTELCKASLCPEYMRVYRRISNLRKKMETLGIGGIVSPDNKQNISIEGWRLHFFSGVRIELRKSFFQFAGVANGAEMRRSVNRRPASGSFGILEQNGLQRYIRPSSLRPEPRNWAEIFAAAFSVFIVWSSELLYSRIAWHNNSLGAIESVFIVISGFFLSFLSLLTFFPNRRNTFIIFLGMVTSFSLGLTLLLDAALPEGQMAFSLLKTCMLFLIVYYANLPRFFFDEVERNRRFTVKVSFWIIWFYLMGLLVIRNTFLSPFTFYKTSSWHGIVVGIMDQLLFLAVLLFTLLYIMRQPQKVEVSKDKVVLNGTDVGQGLAAPNIQILRKFLRQRNGILVCSAVVEEIYPAENGECSEECKSSVCPAYQKSYKRIRELRNFLETLDVGTILSPDKNANVKEEGWKLLLYRDVHVVGR